MELMILDISRILKRILQPIFRYLIEGEYLFLMLQRGMTKLGRGVIQKHRKFSRQEATIIRFVCMEPIRIVRYKEEFS